VNMWVSNKSVYFSESMAFGSCAINQELNLPSVNVKSGTSVDLEFQYRSPGFYHTRELTIGSFFITILDLEHGQAVEAANFAAYDLGFDSLIEVKHATSDKYKLRFESRKEGKAGDKAVGGKALTKEQKRSAISFHFENLSTFYMNFEVAGDPEVSGQSFTFTGNTSISNIRPDSMPLLPFASSLGAQSQHGGLTEIMNATDGQHSKRVKHYNRGAGHRNSLQSSALKDSELAEVGDAAPHAKEVEHAAPIGFAAQHAGRQKQRNRLVRRSLQ